ncbi:MAG TPA: oligosaccharide flippase family protein, partial [Planctomycetota bacterium]|nr:oligosaccharide flippase family protein [Planctomycetota bacterium]
MSIYREIFKHSSIYAAGQILSRLASIILLPLYTAFLTPQDYGVMALLDITLSIFGFLAAAGISSAVIRFHFDAAYKESQHALWTTGLFLTGLLALPQLALALAFREPLADFFLGSEIPDAPYLLVLALLSLTTTITCNYSAAYLRVQKRSVLFICLTVPDLLLRIALNIFFIAFLRLGVLGFLYSTLIVGSLQSIVVLAILFAGKPFQIIRHLLLPFLSYGWPLIVTSFASLAMHKSNVYFLRWFLNDMALVGVFGVAYTMAQGVNSLVITPFFSIWTTLAFEINELPERGEIFERVFKYFVLGLSLVLLGVALFSVPIIKLMTQPAFYEAARLLPILCLAFLFFPLHAFFRLPAMIHKKTGMVATNSLIAAAAACLFNMALIPPYGMYGSAVASVFTYAVFSFAGYGSYQRLE